MRFSVTSLLWATFIVSVLLTGVEVGDRCYTRHQLLDVTSHHILLIQQLQAHMSGTWTELDKITPQIQQLQYQVSELQCQISWILIQQDRLNHKAPE